MILNLTQHVSQLKRPDVQLKAACIEASQVEDIFDQVQQLLRRNLRNRQHFVDLRVPLLNLRLDLGVQSKLLLDVVEGVLDDLC